MFFIIFKHFEEKIFFLKIFDPPSRYFDLPDQEKKIFQKIVKIVLKHVFHHFQAFSRKKKFF